ncbi:MAG: hypothetical protein AB7P02_25880 [Alphaproteobacteria bacterium]
MSQARTRRPHAAAGPSRVPGTIGLATPGAALPPVIPAGGHAPGPRPPPLTDEMRRMLQDLRRRLRQHMAEMEQESPLPRNGAIFYSGVDEPAVRAFCDHLLAIDPRQPAERRIGRRPVHLEATRAGMLLVRMTRMVLQRLLLASPDDDWTTRVALRSGPPEATVSLIGFWRELSARYARMAAGTVQVLLGPGREHLVEAGRQFWSGRTAEGGQQQAPSFAQLRTFGFVEVPILLNMIADNRRVDRLAIHAPRGEGFIHLRDIQVREGEGRRDR